MCLIYTECIAIKKCASVKIPYNPHVFNTKAKTKILTLLRRSDSLFGQETSHGVGSPHEQHHLSVEIDEERSQEPTGDPSETQTHICHLLICNNHRTHCHYIKTKLKNLIN